MKKLLWCLILILTFIFGVQPAFAQANLEYQLLRKEIDALKQGQAGMKQDLQDIKKLIQSRPAGGGGGGGDVFKEAMINIKGAPIKGDKNAKLVLIEFSDYQ